MNSCMYDRDTQCLHDCDDCQQNKVFAYCDCCRDPIYSGETVYLVGDFCYCNFCCDKTIAE